MTVFFKFNSSRAFQKSNQLRLGFHKEASLVFLYVLYTVDGPVNNANFLAIFVDDDHSTTSENLHVAVDEFLFWAASWKIKINNTKSARLDFALRFHPMRHTTLDNGDIARYLGVYLDQKPNRRVYVKKKREEVKLRFRSLYTSYSIPEMNYH